jgi:hypothetical protein
MDNTQKAYEAALAEIWMEHFGEPLPMLGAPEIADKILREHGVKTPRHPSETRDEGAAEG